MKLSILVPVYNEEKTIKEVLEKVKHIDVPEKEIVIANDGSTDGTSEILSALQDDIIKVINYDKNEGKGSVIRKALEFVTGDRVVIQDADLEYDPNDIPKLLQAMDETGSDVVYGSRFLGEAHNIHFLNYMANKFLTMLVNITYGSHLTDSCTCYKLFRKEVITDVDLKCDGFEVCHQITADVLKKKKKLVEVPIWYQARTITMGKKVKWWDLFTSTYTIIKFRFMD